MEVFGNPDVPRHEGEGDWEYAIRSNTVRLDEEMDTAGVLYALRESLGQYRVEIIEREPTSRDRNFKLLEYVRQLRKFSDFILALAGINPELFQLLTRREPTVEEKAQSLGNYPQFIRDSIKEGGNKPDKVTDEPINLTEQFIHLSVVECDDACGQRPDVFEAKGTKNLKKIRPEEILGSEGEQSNTTIVTGRGGVGKTTTSQWLCHRWANHLWANTFTVMWLLAVRNFLTIKRPLTFLQLISRRAVYTTGEAYHLSHMKTWLRHNSKDVVIFIDGLDELQQFGPAYRRGTKVYAVDEEAEWEDILINILRKHLLPECTVVVFSRPFPDLGIMRGARRVEIQGLSREAVTKYIMVFAPPTQKDRILAAITNNPILRSLCSITAYCAMLCTLELDVGSTDALQTYGEMLSFIILRYLTRSPSDDSPAPSAVVKRNKALIRSLARLAGSGLGATPVKIVFIDEDIDRFDVDRAAARMSGLIQIEGDGHAHESVEFVHLLVYEFLGAMDQVSGPTVGLQTFMAQSQRGQYDVAQLMLYFHVFNGCKHARLLRDCLPTDHLAANRRALMERVRLMAAQARSRDDDRERLTVMVIAHEANNPDVTRIVASQMVKDDSSIHIDSEVMTAVDVLSVLHMVHHCGITTLELVDCNLDEACVAPIAGFLRTNATVTSLNLHGNDIGNGGARIMAEAFGSNQTLEYVDLDNNDISGAAGEALVAAAGQIASLKRLDVIDNDIAAPSEGSVRPGLKVLSGRVRDQIAASPEGSNSAKYMCCAETQVSETGLQSFLAALAGNNSLNQLSINNTQIGNRGLEALAAILKLNSTLWFLIIDHTQIGNRGLEALAAMLKQNRILEWLSIAHTQIGDRGLEALAAMLKQNRILQILSLSFTAIGDVGIMAFAEVLLTNTVLQNFSLYRTPTDDEGLTDLSQALKGNHTLQVFVLQRMNITSRGLRAISGAIAGNTTLEVLHLAKLDMDDDGAVAVSAVLGHYRTFRNDDYNRLIQGQEPDPSSLAENRRRLKCRCLLQ